MTTRPWQGLALVVLLAWLWHSAAAEATTPHDPSSIVAAFARIGSRAVGLVDADFTLFIVWLELARVLADLVSVASLIFTAQKAVRVVAATAAARAKRWWAGSRTKGEDTKTST